MILKNSDIEQWRVERELQVPSAMACLGIPWSKWKSDVIGKPGEPIGDKCTAMLLQLYRLHPEVVPIQDVFDIKTFLSPLMEKHPELYARDFAPLFGRTEQTLIHYIGGKHTPSRPISMYGLALKRLGYNENQTLDIMRKLASTED